MNNAASHASMAPLLALDSDVAPAEWTEPLGERVSGVQPRVFQIRQKGLAARPHALDDWRLEAVLELVLVRLGDATDEEDVAVPSSVAEVSFQLLASFVHHYEVESPRDILCITSKTMSGLTSGINDL